MPLFYKDTLVLGCERCYVKGKYISGYIFLVN